VPQVIVVHPQRVPVNDLKGLLEVLRKSPGKLNYASAGNGTSHHLAGELFKIQTKTFITHIPYRGAGPALQDLITGSADLMFDGLGSSAAHIKGGRIKALLVSGTKRSPALPDVPCAAEVGLPDYTVTTWYGLWAPKGTPPELQNRIAEEVRKTIQSDELKAIWASQGAEFPNLAPPQFASFINGEIKRWAQVVKTANVKAD
jgi:tripartite-type tricarboxylate transporter receptor subunit TctC